jgi:acetolactate synthase-1/3 small subunit
MALSYAISVLLNDDLLAFNRVIGVVRRRNLLIESIAVGASQVPGVSRLTFMLQADEASADRLVRQLQKTFGVREAVMFPAADVVAREVALIKVNASPPPSRDRADLLGVVSQFKASVVDEGPGVCIVEIAGSASLTASFIGALERFGIIEIARSGAVALRGADGPSRSPSPTHPSEAVP